MMLNSLPTLCPARLCFISFYFWTKKRTEKNFANNWGKNAAKDYCDYFFLIVFFFFYVVIPLYINMTDISDEKNKNKQTNKHQKWYFHKPLRFEHRFKKKIESILFV